MRRRPKIALLVVLATVALGAVCALLALLLSFESRPRVPATAAPTAEEIARLERSLRRQDPRRLEPGETGTLSLSDRELAAALRQALALVGSKAAVLVDLEPGRLSLKSSVELPVGLPGRFLNVDLVMRETESLPRFERLRVGRTPVPARLADAAWRWAVTGWLKERGGADVLEMVETVALADARLEVTYRWLPGTVESLRAGIVGETERQRLEAFSNELAVLTQERDARRVSLAELLGPLFELAQARSRSGDPVAENRAAVLVLGSYVNRQRLDTLVPKAAEWPRPRSLEPTLRGKYDLARHFMTSALVAAVGGSALSDALGLSKELEDSRGGSGFSFQDLAADRAGTRFGELATASRDSARRIQRLLAGQTSEDRLLPKVQDLPEGLSEAELERLIGEVGSPRYQELTAEIERRIDASPLYREP